MRTRDLERDLKIPKSLAKRLIWRPTRRRLKRYHPHEVSFNTLKV